jgi:hypothetical protein
MNSKLAELAIALADNVLAVHKASSEYEAACKPQPKDKKGDLQKRVAEAKPLWHQAIKNLSEATEAYRKAKAEVFASEPTDSNSSR